MASIREIKTHIKSINETRQITKAMKLISAAKLKKARLQHEQTKPYFIKVETTMADILAHTTRTTSMYFDERAGKPKKTTGLIILTGDKGLAGGYNHNIIKLSEDMIGDAENPLLFVAGHVGWHYFARKGYNLDRSFLYPVQSPTVYRAREISEIILEKFKKGEVDEFYLAYTEMVSSIRLVPQAMRLLPLNLELLRSYLHYSIGGEAKGNFIHYEPSAVSVFDVLVSQYVKGVIYGALVEAFVSEQSARMTAMDNATENADEMLHKLQLTYNRARQAAITQEISEIVGGASAL